MKRNLMIGLVVVIVAIVVISAVAIISLGTQDNKNYTLEVGYFLKYEESWNNTSEKHNITFEILGLNATYVYYKQTESWSNGERVNYYNATKNETPFADFNHPPAGINLTYLGKENIDTKWGAISTDHYNISSSVVHEDFWIRNGVLVKFELSLPSLPWMSVTNVLVDTNMPQITD